MFQLMSKSKSQVNHISAERSLDPKLGSNLGYFANYVLSGYSRDTSPLPGILIWDRAPDMSKDLDVYLSL